MLAASPYILDDGGGDQKVAAAMVAVEMFKILQLLRMVATAILRERNAETAEYAADAAVSEVHFVKSPK